MNINKYFWFIRGLFYKLFFGKFGNLSYIGSPTFIKNSKKIFIGNKVRIYPNSRMEVYDKGLILIEDNVSCGHNMHLTAFKKLIIGSGTSIAGNVLVMSLAHKVIIKDKPFMEQPLTGKETIIGKNCLIGSNSVIMAGVVLGDQCLVAANSVVTESFDSYSIIAGSPAKFIKKIEF